MCASWNFTSKFEFNSDCMEYVLNFCVSVLNKTISFYFYFEKQTEKKTSYLLQTVPCPPESLTLVESSVGNCTLTWNTVPYADSYEAFVKKGDGGEATCNSTSNNCTYQCQCGYTYLMSVLSYNLAGSSPEGTILNYTTGE